MAIDRGGNTLRQARRLAVGATMRDFVGRRDRNDLYRISFGSSSQVSLKLSGVQRGAKLKAEIFSLKGSIGRIGKINFSSLTPQQIRQNLLRIGSGQVINRSLQRGDYYLRISPQRGDSRYRLTVTATPLDSNPAPDPDPEPNPNPGPNPTPDPVLIPTPDPTPAPATFARSWLRQFGSSSNDYAYGAATDSSGNLYVAGTTPNAVNDSTTDAFVAKYDASGNQVWLRSFDLFNNSDTAFDVAVDVQGNYYVVGVTNINTSFSSLNSDGFIAKFASDGSRLWQQEITSTVSVPFLGTRNALDAAASVAIDASGNAYVTGFTKALPVGNDESRAFVAKYSTNGDRQWFTEYGGAAADAAADLDIDAAGNVYITGIRDADLTTDRDNPFEGGDAFVAKFSNATGALQWERLLGTASAQDYARSIAVTANGSLYITGQTDGTLPGQTSAGGRDGFIARYGSDGTQVWVRQFGTSELDEGQGIALAPDGSIYLTGETAASLFGQPHAGAADAWFAQYAPNGDRIGRQQFGTAQDDESYNLTLDSTGNLYIVGQTTGIFPGESNAGAYDAWVAKYSPV